MTHEIFYHTKYLNLYENDILLWIVGRILLFGMIEYFMGHLHIIIVPITSIHLHGQ